MKCSIFYIYHHRIHNTVSLILEFCYTILNIQNRKGCGFNPNDSSHLTHLQLMHDHVTLLFLGQKNSTVNSLKGIHKQCRLLHWMQDKQLHRSAWNFILHLWHQSKQYYITCCWWRVALPLLTGEHVHRNNWKDEYSACWCQETDNYVLSINKSSFWEVN